MNFYQRHIGDYLKATSHLSLLEHGIYTRLLDVYYTREGAIPTDQAARLVGARSKDEKASLDAVLAEFFTRENDGWHQKRCDKELFKYKEKSAKASESAFTRWGKAHTERNTNAMRTHSEGNAPNNQEPITNKTPSAATAVAFSAGAFSVSDEILGQWRTAYPAVDVRGEMAKASAWLTANPKNRKSNYARFLNSWLTKAQDRAPRAPHVNGNQFMGGI